MSRVKFQWEKELRYDTNLSATEFRVLMMLGTWANQSLGNAHPGRARLAEAACVSIPTVKRALRNLEMSGYIVVESQGGNAVQKGHATVYRLTLAEERGTGFSYPQGGHGRPPSKGAQGGQIEPQGGQMEHAKGVTGDPPSVQYINVNHHHSVSTLTGPRNSQPNDDDHLFKFDAWIDEFEDEYGALDEMETRVVEGMYQSGSALPAIRNKILKDRRFA